MSSRCGGFFGLPDASRGVARCAACGDAGLRRNKQTATAEGFNTEQLDALLAPIALYPDELLTQILMASTFPLQVVEAGRWAD